ncbi:MAG: PAS domain-containing sensor histidine kinase [Cyclobacteriaceae bacterium]|nr:PAS domain-containing sensor histidine kinase [Cyclobacteriaceae bacterium]MCH8516587.1 PAS domain-containing sensor histidine kinase [Cyclobacteriaceae bacterium]
MSLSDQFILFDLLPIGVVLLSREKVVYANQKAKETELHKFQQTTNFLMCAGHPHTELSSTSLPLKGTLVWHGNQYRWQLSLFSEGFFQLIFKISSESNFSLHDRVDKISAVYDNNGIPALVTDVHKNILYINSELSHVLGVQVKHLEGEKLDTLGFDHDSLLVWEKQFDRLRNDPSPFREIIHLDNDKVISGLFSPIFDERTELRAVLVSFKNLTPVYEQHHALAKEIERFDQAFSLAKVATWEIRTEEDVILLNKSFCELHDIHLSDYQGKRMLIADYIKYHVHPSDHDIFLTSYQTFFQSDLSTEEGIVHYRIFCGLEKKVKWIKATAKSRKIASRIYGLYGTLQDQTAVKNVELKFKSYLKNLERVVENKTAELIESKRKLDDACHLAGLGSWEFYIEKEEYRFNPIVIKMLALEDTPFAKKQKIKHSIFIQRIHPEDLEEYLEKSYVAIKNNDPDKVHYLNYRLLGGDDQYRQLYVSIKVLLDANGQHLKHYGTIQDLTRYHEILDRNKLLQSIVQNTPDLIATMNQSGEIVYFNQSLKNFYSLSDNDRIVRDSLQWQAMTNDLSFIFNEEVQEALEKIGVWSGEVVLRKPNGAKVPASQVIINHKDDDDKLKYYSFIIRDISDQKRIEKDLIFKNNELDTFIYRASHDLKGPITTLMGLSNVATLDLTDSKAKRYLRLYDSEVERMRDIVVSLVDLTRIKDQEVKLERVNIDQFLDQQLQRLSDLPGYEKVDFHCVNECREYFVTDLQVFSIIFKNIVENSIVFQAHDRKAEIIIRFTTIKNPDGLFMVVEDNGLGIPDEARDKLFNMFYRGSERSKGSGLGLYNFKNAVEKLGGYFNLDSTLNKGTKISVFIPSQ